MNSLLGCFHSLSLPGAIFPKGLKLHVVTSIPSTCIEIVGIWWLSFIATFTDLLNCFASPAILAETPGKVKKALVS